MAQVPDQGIEDLFPATLQLGFYRSGLHLRYGENPHQQAAAYVREGANPWWASAVQHFGLPLSYLNLFDADAAWRLVNDPAFGIQPRCAIIKHANPCGFAVADDKLAAYRSAYECDPRSAFGGIVAFSRPVSEEVATAMSEAAQADVIIAPGYGGEAVEILRAKRKNTRVLVAGAPDEDALHIRPITGGLLVQQPHHFAVPPEMWRVVTERQPTREEFADAQLAHLLGGYVRSNSIVLVQGGVAWGIGAGQQNRLESAEIAAKKAANRAQGGACGSDAFFPFPDGVDAAADAGVAVIIQPGGSVRDDACIARANERRVAMIFTGERHFVH
jgi:phosphoribosylaminoimidazolecarboxamide formyltransferase/IMP cyclohydrolase